MPRNFFSEFKEVFGILPREYLGMTETNAYTVNAPEGKGLKAGSVGRTFPEVSIEIRDPQGSALPSGAEGEIWVRTPAAMVLYWEDPEKTREVMCDGWVATGDAGHLDEDGFLWFAGRLKHIIICDGDNIHPRHVEHEIARHPAVAKACVVGVPHSTRGETVGAAVIPRNPAANLPLRSFPTPGEPTDRSENPEKLLVLDQFPLTANGKIDRRVILRLLQKRGGSRSESWFPVDAWVSRRWLSGFYGIRPGPFHPLRLFE